VGPLRFRPADTPFGRPAPIPHARKVFLKWLWFPNTLIKHHSYPPYIHKAKKHYSDG